MKIVKIQNKSLVRRLCLAALLVGAGFMLKGILTPQMGAPVAMGTPFVTVQVLTKQDVSEKKKFIAEVEAINSVDIVPQTDGKIQEVLFADGSFVKEGDLLFQIGDSTSRANLQAAEADLEKAKSDYVQIDSDYKRQLKLYQERVIAKATLEIAENKINQAKAAIKQAQANVEIAKINLGYTQIRSPINGFISKALMTKGNYVSPSTPSLARVVQTNPIRIVFSLSDKERMNLMGALQKESHFEIVYPNGMTKEIEIENLFTSHEINADTATVPVYIDYKNADNLLLPGNYVDILVRLNDKKEAVLVPLTALAQDADGTYAMIVNKAGLVEQKYLKLGRVFDIQQEVLEGLNPGDQVIVQGLQKVQAGMKVQTVIAKS